MKRLWMGSAVLIGIALWGAWVAFAPGAAMPQGATVTGWVLNLDGERVPGAVVRRQTANAFTLAEADASFSLGGLPEGVTVTVTAWDEGYYPGGVEVVPPGQGVTITLKPHPQGDNTDYAWYTSMPDPEEPLGCGHCMVAFPQWVENAHAGSATNPRFFSLYNGTDVSGTVHLGGGYKDDFPGTAGNCATCHAPGAAIDAPYSTDMNQLAGVDTEGVFCEVCHKIGDTYLNPATGRPYANAPGTVSYRFYRPPVGTHMFFGPFDDVTRRVSYSELETRSEFCAACHEFSFWGTPIYESFSEWQASPYPAQGIECQTCHMAPTGVDYFVYPEKGGLIRDPARIASHLQPGAADEPLLQNTVVMTVAAQAAGDTLTARVTITNTEAGHHVPTDFPGRHMILTLSATDKDRSPLARRRGSVVPAWGGPQAGQPGTAFAKVLKDVATGEYPVMNYWKQTLIVSDTRIPAMERYTGSYIFDRPEGMTASDAYTVTAELRFRRGFYEEMEARGWDTPDIVMETVSVVVEGTQAWRIYLPLIVHTQF